MEDHRIDCYVADVIAVLDGLGVERAAFWGYSAGTWIGYALAAAHPERVAALIATGAIAPRDYSDPAERLDTVGRAELVRRHGLVDAIPEWGRAEGIAIPDWFARQMTDTDREMFALELLGTVDWQGPWSILPQVRCPVLMLVGELEDPEDDNHRAAAFLANGRCVTLPGLGHIGTYLRSDLALLHAVPFLQAIRNESTDAEALDVCEYGPEVR